MRFWQWGQADAEAADWTCQDHTFRTTFGPWGMTVNSAEFDAQDANPTELDIGNLTGMVSEAMLKIAQDQIRAKLGQVPILLQADIIWTHTEYGTDGSGVWETRRMLVDWNIGDYTNWRRKKTAAVYWYQSKQHVVRGRDVEEAAADTGTWAHVYGAGNWEQSRMPIRSIVERSLRDNTDLWIHMSTYHVYGSLPPGRTQIVFNPSTSYDRRPYIAFAYLYPVEFYKDDGSGDLDLSSAVGDNPGDEYYLGAVEPGQTGTPVKAHIRNYSGDTQQVEIFDDHPEYTDPVTRVGTGQLDYILLGEAAVSQKYTCIFYSATQYEIQAVAYRDNAISLHPTINADADWRGDTSSLFTAVEGGLSIPAEAWQGADIALDDEIETGVTGNTTDTGWPADSNEQVEITHDDAGSADATGWRLITGHREKTKVQVTVDATTKFFPTRAIVPADWPVDTKAFIQDQTNINEGEISSTQEASIGTPSHVGSGLDDFAITGNFNGIWTNTLRVKIDGTGTPDTFTWSMDNGVTWEETAQNCSSIFAELPGSGGIFIRWLATTGHTLDDYWNVAVESWGIELKALTANSNVYNSGSAIGTSLPIRDVAATVFSSVSAASGVSEGTPARLWVADTTGFAPGNDVFIQSPAAPSNSETIEIDSIGTGYLDLVTAMTLDYSIGDFVTKVGSGEEAFWMRPVATAVTVEELKRLRLNARLL